MQIELIGPTSSGKTTLGKRLRRIGDEQGINSLMADEFILNKVRLNWLKNHWLRVLVLDSFSLLACLLLWRKHQPIFALTVRVIRRLPPEVGRYEKLNIVRNVIKQLGVYEIVYQLESQEEMIWMDEGTLQMAHYLFVHVSQEPDLNELETFLKLVPLPDLVYHAYQPHELLVSRTMARGHNRIRERSEQNVILFTGRAQMVFEKLLTYLEAEQRLVPVDNFEHLWLRPDRHSMDLETGPAALIKMALSSEQNTNLHEADSEPDSWLSHVRGQATG